MSNDANLVWYVSFHGGSKSSAWNNMHVFTTSGDEAKPSKALNTSSLAQHVDLQELRGFTFGPDGNLYVTNAYCKYSQLLRFNGQQNDDGQHDFFGTFVQYQWLANPGLAHPFQGIFGLDGNLYVASQDTPAVTRYYGPASATPGAPMPLPSALEGCASCYPGSFVPNKDQAEQGILSVRGIAFGPDGNLYVADEDANALYVYHGVTGAFLNTLLDKEDGLNAPDHLLFDGSILYIGNSGQETDNGGKGAILSIDTADSGAHVNTYLDNSDGKIDGPAGMRFGTDGNDTYFYVASRNGNRILYYKPNQDNSAASYQGKLVDNLDDNPEFIMQLDPTRITSTQPTTPSLFSTALCGS